MLTGGALLVACGISKEPEKKEDQPEARPSLVGRVASIPQGKSFLLIETIGEWEVADGTILTTRGDEDRSANLLVTGERLGQFAAADIQAGTAQVGDSVLLPPAAPQNADSESVGEVLTTESEGVDSF